VSLKGYHWWKFEKHIASACQKIPQKINIFPVFYSHLKADNNLPTGLKLRKMNPVHTLIFKIIIGANIILPSKPSSINLYPANVEKRVSS
jgi:hypothetical protein